MTLDRRIMPPIGYMDDFNIQRPVRKIMPDGMTLNVLRAGMEDVIRLDLVVGSGQLDQDYPLQAMMTNRMLREGTDRMTSEKIAEKLDYYGAWVDLSSSADSGFVTLYSPGKFFEKIVRVLASMIKEPAFPERELKIVEESNRQAFLVNAQRVEVMARKRLATELFGPEHPLGRFAGAEDYGRLTTEMLRAFYDDNYCPDNCTMFVAGKINDKILRCIGRHFGKASWGRDAKRNASVMPEPRGMAEKRVNVEKKDGMQSAVRIGCLLPDSMHEDFLDLKVLNAILGGYFGSRLMKNIREDKGYTYGIGSGIVTYPGCSMLVISTETGNEHVEDVIRETRNEIERLKCTPPDKDELTMVKNYMTGEICRAYENALSISDAWIYALTAGTDDDFFDRTAESVKNITGNRIMELAGKYLDWDKMVEIVAGNV